MNINPVRIGAVVMLSSVVAMTGCQESGRSARVKTSPYEQILQKEPPEKSPAPTPTSSDKQGNVRVVAQVLSVPVSDFAAMEALWRYVDTTPVEPTRPAEYRESGFRIGVSQSGFDGQLGLLKERLADAHETELNVLITDRGFEYLTLDKGITVPAFYYRQHWYSRIDYDFAQTGKALKVAAKQFSDGTIQLELTPIFRDLMNISGDVSMADLTVLAAIEPGRHVVIGTDRISDKSAADAAGAYLSSRNGDQFAQIVVTLTAAPE